APSSSKLAKLLPVLCNQRRSWPRDLTARALIAHREADDDDPVPLRVVKVPIRLARRGGDDGYLPHRLRRRSANLGKARGESPRSADGAAKTNEMGHEHDEIVAQTTCHCMPVRRLTRQPAPWRDPKRPQNTPVKRRRSISRRRFIRLLGGPSLP